MKRSMLVPATVAVTLLLPTAAAAKGPSQASISGGGVGKTIRLAGNGESDATPLGSLAMESGFYPAAYGQSPDPLLPARPKGNLGPRLTIRFVVPGPNGRTFDVSQDLYAYARGGAVTYMKPGQPIFDTTTRGGWYRAYGLKRTLLRQGLPVRAPSGSSGMSLALLAEIPGALVLVGTAVLFRRRRV